MILIFVKIIYNIDKIYKYKIIKIRHLLNIIICYLIYLNIRNFYRNHI